MVFWPQLIGGIEIEERRPRYFNEPRRKRLSFVKSSHPSSGEWALVNGSRGRIYHESEQSLWDRRQFEANQRFMQQQQQQLLIDRERAMLHQPIPRPQLQSWNPEGERERGHDPRIQPLPPPPPGHNHLGERGRGHHDDHDHVIEAVSSDSNSDDEDDDHHDHRPRLIERAPKNHLLKHFKNKRSKSRGRKGKREKRASSLFSSDSSSDDDFVEGFRYGMKAAMVGRPLSRRGRSRSRVFDHSDDSFEDLEPRLLRSKSRGAKWRRR